MIFYFTGTGNSLYAAKHLLSDGESLIDMASALKDQSLSFSVAPDEPVGFVFPVYFYTVPTIVADFIRSMHLNGSSYVYAVITCGGSICQAGTVLKKLLREKELPLHYVTSLLMPDNSMLFYQIPEQEKASTRLESAAKALTTIREDIVCRRSTTIGNMTLLSDLVGLGYRACSKTAGFYAQEHCISCGICVKNCPQSVIRLEQGKPVWTKEHCCKCSACINRCPVQAIQYGKGTIKRNRYVNPTLKQG